MHYLYLITRKNLVSVSKLEVLFGMDFEIRTKDGTIFPSEEHDNLILWKTVNSTGTENCNLVSGDRRSLWHKRQGHDNIEDLLKLKHYAIGLRISDHDGECCETCQLNESKKLLVLKDSGTRAKDVLEIVHTDILEAINPEAVDGIGFVDSFSRYQKMYFLKTRDDAIEKVRQFFADVGKKRWCAMDRANSIRTRLRNYV